jgi:hypothetical protein
MGFLLYALKILNHNYRRHAAAVFLGRDPASLVLVDCVHRSTLRRTKGGSKETCHPEGDRPLGETPDQ